MKTLSPFRRLTALFLCLCLLLIGPPALTHRASAQALPAGIVLVCVGIGACIIIKAMHRPEPLIDRVLVLQVNYRNGTGWQNVVTNFHAVLYSDKPCSIFGVQIHMIGEEAESAKFRVEDITEWWRENHSLIPQGTQYANGAWSIP